MRRYLVLVIAGALGCSGDDGPSDPGNGDSDFTVSVVNNAFSPSALSVPVNSTVTWQWNSSGVVHNVTFQDVPPSASQATGSFSRLFSAAGTFAYVCTLHAPSMSGTVTVTASGGGGGGGGGGDDGGGGGYP
jgi:plastocyanin